ncbi:MAG: helix-turn-helix domain-containing protein [Mycobacteriales bacterium]
MTAALDLTGPSRTEQELFGHVGTTVPETVGRPTKFLVTMLMVGWAATGTLTSVSPADVMALTSAAHQPTTVPALPSQPLSVMDNAIVKSLLQRLRRVSGLDWGDIARALGVSRRTIHNWLGGARIAGVHLVRLLEFDRLVNSSALGQPENTRAYLLQPRANGRSIVDEMELSARPTRRVPLSTLSVAEQLAPVSEEPELVNPIRHSALRGGQMPRRHPKES